MTAMGMIAYSHGVAIIIVEDATALPHWFKLAFAGSVIGLVTHVSEHSANST